MMNGMPGGSLPADGQETVIRWVHRQKRTLDKLYEEYRADILSVQEKEAARYAAITEELIREYDAKV